MNKKLVLSVLSTAVVASMASAAMAKPPGPGFLVGGDVDKYYSLEAFLGNHFDEALDGILDNLDDTYYVTPDRNIVGFIDAVYAKTADELKEKEVAPTKAHFGDNVYAVVGEEGKVYNPAEDDELLPGGEVPAEVVVESVSATTPTSLKVQFANAVAELDKASVAVKNAETGEKQYVKDVALAQDGKTATIELYEALENGKTYNVTVTVGENSSSKDFEFAVGEVATIEAAASQLVKAGNSIDLTKLDYKVLDAAGVDVTSTTTVSFQATVNVTNNTINLTDGQTAFVYVTAQKEDGTEVKSNRITVKAEAPKPAVITNYTVSNQAVDFDDENYKQSLVVQKGQTNFQFYVEAEDQFGDVYQGAATPTFESLDKTVALVDRSTGVITALKEGSVPVKITYGQVTQTVELTIVADAKASTLELSETELSISNSVTTPTAVEVSVKDQYENVFDFTGNATVTVLSGKDIVTVNNTLGFTNGKATLNITPVAQKSGTAVIEVKFSDAIKATVTVNVTAAGIVDNYVIEGFKATLDKYDNPNTTTVDESVATLDVFPVDANGVKTGDQVAATYTVTDEEGTKVVTDEPTTTPIDAKDVAFEAGKTYTVAVKVGTIEVFTETFTVVDSTPKPVVTQKGSKVNAVAGDDVFADLGGLFEITFGGKVNNTAEVVGIKFISDNSSVIQSSSTAATSVPALGAGTATLSVSEVTVDLDANPSTADQYTVKVSALIDVVVEAAPAPVNNAPVPGNALDQQGTVAGGTITLEAADLATDVDGDTLTLDNPVSDDTNVATVTVNASGELEIVPVAIGEANISVEVSDGQDTITVTFKVEVTA